MKYRNALLLAICALDELQCDLMRQQMKGRTSHALLALVVLASLAPLPSPACLCPCYWSSETRAGRLDRLHSRCSNAVLLAERLRRRVARTSATSSLDGEERGLGCLYASHEGALAISPETNAGNAHWHLLQIHRQLVPSVFQVSRADRPSSAQSIVSNTLTAICAPGTHLGTCRSRTETVDVVVRLLLARISPKPEAEPFCFCVGMSDSDRLPPEGAKRSRLTRRGPQKGSLSRDVWGLY